MALINTLSWFPGICGQKGPAAEASMKEVCQVEIAALTFYALLGEKDAAALAAAKAAGTEQTTAEHWQTGFKTRADEACLANDYLASPVAATTTACGTRDSSAGTGAYQQDAGKKYYARGAGPLPLRGPRDYNQFSKAVAGSEAAFGLAPEAIMGAGPEIGDEFEGKR